MQDVTPERLRSLQLLPALQCIMFGSPSDGPLVTIMDACIAELATLPSLRAIGLSHCVHVGDAGEPNMPPSHVLGCMCVCFIACVLCELAGLCRGAACPCLLQ